MHPFATCFLNLLDFFLIVCVISAGYNKSSNTDVGKEKVTHLYVPPPISPLGITTANSEKHLSAPFLLLAQTHTRTAIKAPMLREGPAKAQNRLEKQTGIAFLVL